MNLRAGSNWFTVGLGNIVQDNETTLKADNANLKIGNNNNTYNGKVEATVENKNTLAPYLTLGFRPNITNNFGVFGEIGAAYTGGQKVTEAKYNSDDSSALKGDLQQDIDDEDLADWMPIAKLGLTYRY